MKKVLFVFATVLALMSQSCSSGKKSRAAEVNLPEAVSSLGNETDFLLAKSFLLSTDSSILVFKTKGNTNIQFELLNRWGESVIKTIGPEFIPSRIFPAPPAAMAPMSQMNWRLSYTSSKGTPYRYAGIIIYSGIK
jgi:hypothetical protein